MIKFTAHKIMIGVIAAVASLAMVGLFTYGAMAARSDDRPPPPSWARPDGTADFEKMPDSFPVLDQEGVVVGHVGKAQILLGGPAEVWGSEGDLVGHLAAEGFVGIGTPIPDSTDRVRVIEAPPAEDR